MHLVRAAGMPTIRLLAENTPGMQGIAEHIRSATMKMISAIFVAAIEKRSSGISLKEDTAVELIQTDPPGKPVCRHMPSDHRILPSP